MLEVLDSVVDLPGSEEVVVPIGPKEVAASFMGLLDTMIENDEVMDFLHTVDVPGEEFTFGDFVVTVLTNFNEVYDR